MLLHKVLMLVNVLIKGAPITYYKAPFFMQHVNPHIQNLYTTYNGLKSVIC